MRVLIRRLASATSASFLRVNTARHFSGTNNPQKKDPEKINSEKKDAQKAKSEDLNKDVEELRSNIIIEKYGGVMTVNIDRQKTRNSLDVKTLREIEAAINAFDKDTEAKVLVLHGEGGSFCSGFDIDELGDQGYLALFDASRRLYRHPLCDKPTIAAVAGYAVAEGFELALSCDLRVIEDTAVLGCLGRRFGAPQSMQGARALTSLIGLSCALDLLITGRLISGKEAHSMGLACKLTSTGTALGESIKLAKSLAKFPQNALMMDKMEAVNSQLNPNSDESMRDEAIRQSLLGGAIEDMKAGVKKFRAGIGRHGKFYKLTEVPLKDWELEDSMEETIVTIDKPQTKDGKS